MQQSFGQRSAAAPAILGLLFIVVGAIFLVAREVGWDLFTSVEGWGWPLFIIVPGLVLLAVALVPARPAGVGFGIAGAVVTTVGSILLYQSRTGEWESWAYAWALIPLAAGAALVLYGLYAHSPSMIRGGTWMSGIGAVLFVVGAWFFQGVFTGETRPQFAESWPMLVVAFGGLLVLRALFVRREPQEAKPDQDRDPA